MKAPRLTNKRLDALSTICALASADLEAYMTDPVPRYTQAEADAMHDAISWVHQMIAFRRAKKASR